MSNRVSLAELAAADIRLRPGEAVTLVCAICAQHLSGGLPGIPSPGVIRLTRDGDVFVEGPITTAQDVTVRAALLLSDLLPATDALPEYRASGALRLVIARALGSIDLPPYSSLDEFQAALSRFATDDVREVACALFAAWESTRTTRAFKAAPRTDLTISDVRRARRATGLSLGYLASVAEVPPTRLRDLEWGYMRDWPPTAEARTQVIRYARAAGLDESIVLSIAWPMILESSSTHSAATSSSVALVPAAPRAIAVVQQVPVPAPPQRHPWRPVLVAAAATLALLSAFAFEWRSSPAAPRAGDGVQVSLSGPGIVPALDGPGSGPPDVPGPDVTGTGGGVSPRRELPVAARAAVIPAVDSRPSAAPEVRAAAPPVKAKRRRAPLPPRETAPEQPKKRSFFERELFRIVIR
jgi:hypothetical protein